MQSDPSGCIVLTATTSHDAPYQPFRRLYGGRIGQSEASLMIMMMSHTEQIAELCITKSQSLPGLGRLTESLSANQRLLLRPDWPIRDRLTASHGLRSPTLHFPLIRREMGAWHWSSDSEDEVTRVWSLETIAHDQHDMPRQGQSEPVSLRHDLTFCIQKNGPWEKLFIPLDTWSMIWPGSSPVSQWEASLGDCRPMRGEILQSQGVRGLGHWFWLTRAVNQRGKFSSDGKICIPTLMWIIARLKTTIILLNFNKTELSKKKTFVMRWKEAVSLKARR